MRQMGKLTAIIAGAATGAVIGMLVAPKKGEKTRKRISDGVTSWVDHLGSSTKELKNIVLNCVSPKPQDFESGFTSLIEKASDKKEDIIATLERKLSKLKAKGNMPDKAGQTEDVVYKAANSTRSDF